jgi:hypothetical protein
MVDPQHLSAADLAVICTNSSIPEEHTLVFQETQWGSEGRTKMLDWSKSMYAHTRDRQDYQLQPTPAALVTIRASSKQRWIGSMKERCRRRAFVQVGIRSISRLTSSDILRTRSEYFQPGGSSVWPKKIVFSFDITHVDSEVSVIRRLSQSHPMGLLPALRNVTN